MFQTLVLIEKGEEGSAGLELERTATQSSIRIRAPLVLQTSMHCLRIKSPPSVLCNNSSAGDRTLAGGQRGMARSLAIVCDGPLLLPSQFLALQLMPATMLAESGGQWARFLGLTEVPTSWWSTGADPRRIDIADRLEECAYASEGFVCLGTFWHNVAALEARCLSPILIRTGPSI